MNDSLSITNGIRTSGGGNSFLGGLSAGLELANGDIYEGGYGVDI